MAQNTMMVAEQAVVANVVAQKEEKTMAQMTVRELKAQAKAAGIKGYSSMKRVELIVALEAHKETTVEEYSVPVTLAPVPVIEQMIPMPAEVEVLECSIPVGAPAQASEQKEQKTVFKARNAAERFNAVLAWLYDQGYHSKRRGYGYTISTRYLQYIVYSTYGWKSGKWALENGKLTEEQIENSAKLIEFLRAKGIIKPAVVTSSKGVKFYGAEYNGMGKNKMTPVKPEHQEAFLTVETARVNTWRIHVEQFRDMCKEMLKVIK